MRQTHARVGFSLTEVMIALGILAVGLAMVGAAFPAALLENKKSVENTMGALICDNGAAVCLSTLSHGDLMDPTTGLSGTAAADLAIRRNVAATEPNYRRIAIAQQAYPVPLGYPSVGGVAPAIPDFTQTPPANVDASKLLQLGDGLWYLKSDWYANPDGQYYPATRYGWLVAGCRTSATANDYVLVIVAYRALRLNDRPGTEIKFSSGMKMGTIAIAAGVPAQRGSVIIPTSYNASTFMVSYVADDSGTVKPTSSYNGAALVVSAPIGGGNTSPVIGCKVVHASLRP